MKIIVKNLQFQCSVIFCVYFIVQLEIKSWLVTGENLSMELLKTEKGNATVALSRLEELQNISASSHKTVRPLGLSVQIGFVFRYICFKCLIPFNIQP